MTIPTGTERIMRAELAAQLLGVSLRTVHRYIERGILPAWQLASGRWRMREGDVLSLRHHARRTRHCPTCGGFMRRTGPCARCIARVSRDTEDRQDGHDGHT